MFAKIYVQFVRLVSMFRMYLTYPLKENTKQLLQCMTESEQAALSNRGSVIHLLVCHLWKLIGLEQTTERGLKRSCV